MSNIQYGSRQIYTPEKVFFIGDVHNEADKLMSVIDQLTKQLGDRDHVVFCGDLVDRGTNAALTIETLVDLCRQYPGRIFFVEGNHDWMLRNYLQTGSLSWIQYLRVTLLDLQNKWNLPDIEPDTIAQALLDHGYKEITSQSVPYYETAEVIATHAPIDLTVAMINGVIRYPQDLAANTDPNFVYFLDRMRDELLWQFTDESRKIPYIDKFRVCGHQAAHHTQPRLFKDRAFIDTGCGLRPNGKLTCMIYPGKKIIQNL